MTLKFRYLNRVLLKDHHGNILQHSVWDNDYGEFFVTFNNHDGKSQHTTTDGTSKSTRLNFLSVYQFTIIP